MADQGDVGISPVLLQAITETLGTASSGTGDDPSSTEKSAEATGENSEVVIITQNTEEEVQANEVLTENLIEHHGGDKNTEIVLEPKSGQRLVIKLEGMEGAMSGLPNRQVINVQGDFDVGKVLAAIANHHSKGTEQDAQGDSGHGSPIILISNSDQSEEVVGTDSSGVPFASTETIVASEDDSHIPTKKQIVITDPNSYNNISVASNMKILELCNVATADAQLMEVSQAVQVVDKYADKGPCPVCGDRVSGFHYGIYSCESCKGFFKRTVQNNKSFSCHKSDGCEITILNRKKCPACRFKKCIEQGMKLEGIRLDRSRGGRSSYGSSPMTSPSANQASVPQQSKSQTSYQRPIIVNPSSARSGASASSPSLVDILKRPPYSAGSSLLVPPPTPVIPQLITDILSVEFLFEEEEQQQCCQDRLTANDKDKYISLLHFADHRLYKIVRWARNLPNFGNVHTDDQILMLQNCWAELLMISVCFRSMGGSDQEIQVSFGNKFSLEDAAKVGMEEIVDHMLLLSQHFKRLRVDKHEFACLKVLVLVNPDIDGLKNADRIREYQDELMEALMTYTSTHYPQIPTKFGEMLVRLGELARMASTGKEMLAQKHKDGSVPTFSLLTELIRGDSILSGTTVQEEEVVTTEEA